MMLPGETARPANLRTVAEALRDEDWLDIGLMEEQLQSFETVNLTVPKVAERVKVLALNVRVDGDDVVVEQRWPGREELHSARHQFDLDDLLWLRPTQVALFDVKPIEEIREPRIESPPSPVLDANFEHHTIAAIVAVICQRTGAKAEDVMNGGSTARTALYERKEAMWCVSEMTNLTPEQITCTYFGYRSVMPLTSIRYRVEALNNRATWVTDSDRDFRKWARDTIKKVDKRLGHCYRRSEQAKPQWWPTLVGPTKP